VVAGGQPTQGRLATRHKQRVGFGVPAAEDDAREQWATRNARDGDRDVSPRRQVRDAVDARRQLTDEPALLLISRPEACLELAAQAPHSACGGEGGVGVADADRRVDAGAWKRGHDGAGEVALFEHADPGPGGRHL
jgi:hypothetical protein